jgi:hypothetical protein
MEVWIARLEGSVEHIERRLSTLEQDLRTLSAKVDRLLYWQLGLLGAIAASILATVLTRSL